VAPSSQGPSKACMTSVLLFLHLYSIYTGLVGILWTHLPQALSLTAFPPPMALTFTAFRCLCPNLTLKTFPSHKILNSTLPTHGSP
jgi:hypothetical protein